MFNFFKKKKENPISKVFTDLTSNQKMSVLNLLISIAVCDSGQGDRAKETKFLNTYIDILGVRSDKSMDYLESQGQSRLISDLKPLSQTLKEFLVIVAFDLINCDGSPNEPELVMLTSLFGQIGINEDKLFEVLKKSQLISKRFQ